MQAAGAAGLLPALPALPAVAAPAAVAPSSIQYAWAAYYAQVHNAVSAERLVAALKISPAAANALMTRLVTRGVIHVPGAAGVATATRPYFKAKALRQAAPKLATTLKTQMPRVPSLDTVAKTAKVHDAPAEPQPSPSEPADVDTDTAQDNHAS